jgi:hypothetical protein
MRLVLILGNRLSEQREKVAGLIIREVVGLTLEVACRMAWSKYLEVVGLIT